MKIGRESSGLRRHSFTSTALSLFGTLLLTGASCTSTDIVSEPDTDLSGEGTDCIVINVGASDIFGLSGGGTRADSDHALRYVAKLYSENSSGNVGVSENCFVAAVEQLSSDGSTIVFTGAQTGKKYMVTIFADYIDAGARRDNNGHYPDKYYTTTSHADEITYRETVDFFNNDNRDCFALKSEVFTKDALVYEESLTLKRVVSKVRVVSKDDNMASLKDITITDYCYAPTYSFEQRGTASYRAKSEAQTVVPSDPSLNELFYFYVFGLSPNFNDPRLGLLPVTFTLNSNDNYTFTNPTVTIGENSNPVVRPQANNIYTIRGSFLSTSLAPSDEIRLYISEESDWAGNSERDI